MSYSCMGNLALALALVSYTSVLAQENRDSSHKNSDTHSSNSDSDSTSNWDQDSGRTRGSENDHEDSQDRKTNGSSQSSQYRLQPEGWLTIGIDTNNDGFYDTFETIYQYDLVQAREASQKRNPGSNQQLSHEGNQQQSQSERNDDAMMRKAKIQGEIVSLKTEQSDESSTPRLVAEVKNSDGRKTHVCLGPKAKLSKLNLEQGNQLVAEGVLAMKENKVVLLAQKVSANDQTVTMNLTNRQGISRLSGELTKLDQAQSRRGDGTYLVAKIKTNDHAKQVHLGPKSQLSKLSLSQGDKVKVLTRKGMVNGKEALVALEVSANGESVKIIPSQSKNEAKKQQEQSRR